MEKCQITGSVLDKNKVQKLTFLLDDALFTLRRNGLTGLCARAHVCEKLQGPCFSKNQTLAVTLYSHTIIWLIRERQSTLNWKN
jgi:hypothetical protein